MKSNKNEIFKIFSITFLFLILYPAISYSFDTSGMKTDSLIKQESDSLIDKDIVIDYKTFRIITNLNEEPDNIREQIYKLEYEMGIPKGKELQNLEIYIDKTNEDKNKWNVLINDTTSQFSPVISWINLTDESKQLLDNWNGRNDKTLVKPDNTGSILILKNKMFRVITVPLVSMNEESKLSDLQKDYTYEVIIDDDFPEQIEIQPNKSLIIKRIDKNTFRLKLSKFNRAEFEKWAENREDDPYIYNTSITVYDKVSKQKTKPINIKFTFGEY